MSKLVEKREELAAKQKSLAEVFADAKLDDGTYDFMKSQGLSAPDAAGRLDEVRQKNAELEDLAKQVADLAELDGIASGLAKGADIDRTPAGNPMHPGAGAKGGNAAPTKSLGELITDAAHGEGGWRKHRDLDFVIPDGQGVKTLMETGAGWAPETLRTGKLVENAQRPVQVIDLIPGNTTNQSSVVYMSETTFTNNAAEASEGGAFGEAALALTEVSSPVRKIAVFLPVTDEQLEDVAQVQGYINNRLTFMLRQRLDGQIMVGDGTAPNLSGIDDRGGIQTQAKGADPVPDAIYKAMTKVRVTGRANPTAVVMHSNDWQEVRLLRTADGVYIWGSPSETGPAMMWGLPVVLCEAITEGNAYVGDYATHCQLSIRRNVTVLISNSHSDYFVKGKQAIRADLRASLEVFREAAFCKVTGI